ncbi:MAG: hypothetical protein MRY21_07500 [Simkaniaceae bacterium]|nr:hypothetical protein [Simkaniaceae bacterium]
MKYGKILAAVIALGMTSGLVADEKSKTLKTQISTDYVKQHYDIGTAFLPNGEQYIVTPKIGWGVRAMEKGAGVDISTSVSGLVLNHGEGILSYSLPKMQYLVYVNPKEEASMVYGLGGSFGGFHSSHADFVGLMANGSIGFEMNRTKKLRSMIQVDGALPVVAIFKQGNTQKPLFEVSFNLGY